MPASAGSTLPADIEEIFHDLRRIFESDEEQNNTLPDSHRSAIVGGLNCDVLPGAIGAFGRTVTNPIPVNGPLGEVVYLSRLRTNAGGQELSSSSSPLMFHRVRAEDGPTGAVDVYEVLSVDGQTREELYLSMYHPRKSNRAPEGYVLAPQLDSDNLTYGVNCFVENFPQKLDAHIRQWQMDMLGIPLPVHRVREAVNGSRFKPSLLDKNPTTGPLGNQMQNDVLTLLHAMNDPRFDGSLIGIGYDGIVRSLPADTILEYWSEDDETPTNSDSIDANVKKT